MKKELIVFIDSGDTIVDESTEIRDENGVVISADLLTGAKDMIINLHESGYRIALVADGLTKSFRNVYKMHNLEHVFEVWTISEELRVEKPNALMFRTAMEQMGLSDDDKKRIVMIGNNIKRDVVGANRMGIISILESCSPRYIMQPNTEEETPDYVVAEPSEIPALLEQLNLQVINKRILEKN